MKKKPKYPKLLTLFFVSFLVAPLLAADLSVADPSTWLPALCSTVDCLNNFTAKTGYDLANAQWTAGGFTDLKQSWYISPGPGFGKPLFGDNAQAFFDMNAIVKVGTFLNNHVPFFHQMAGSEPLAQGLLKYSTFGYSLSYDFTNGVERRWRHGPWAGFYIPFGPSGQPTN